MNFEYKKIEAAFAFVSSGQFLSHKALLDTETGDVLFQTESGELDEFPEDIEEGRYKAVPSRIELRLGKPLVVSFVKTHVPDALAEVCRMFCHKNASSRFKEFLDAGNRLDQWREYEREETEKALRKWCQETGIALKG